MKFKSKLTGRFISGRNTGPITTYDENGRPYQTYCNGESMKTFYFIFHSYDPKLIIEV